MDASNPCKGAFIGLHLSASSSAYIENVWNWVADHITEGFSGGSSIAAKGGTLVEATQGTWLHALGSEHYWLYQLNLRQARNVLVTLLQSETNYEQGASAASVVPAPWSADVAAWGDPDYAWCGGGDKRCRMGLSNYIRGGADIYHYGSASWAFFSGPGQSCTGNYQCQGEFLPKSSIEEREMSPWLTGFFYFLVSFSLNLQYPLVVYFADNFIL